MNKELIVEIEQYRNNIREICLDIRFGLNTFFNKLDIINDFLWTMERLINYIIAYTDTTTYPHIKEYEPKRYDAIKTTERQNYDNFYNLFQISITQMSQLTNEINFCRKQELDDNISKLIRNMRLAIMEYSLGNR